MASDNGLRYKRSMQGLDKFSLELANHVALVNSLPVSKKPDDTGRLKRVRGEIVGLLEYFETTGKVREDIGRTISFGTTLLDNLKISAENFFRVDAMPRLTDKMRNIEKTHPKIFNEGLSEIEKIQDEFNRLNEDPIRHGVVLIGETYREFEKILNRLQKKAEDQVRLEAQAREYEREKESAKRLRGRLAQLAIA